jgi:hypothetical protein
LLLLLFPPGPHAIVVSKQHVRSATCQSKLVDGLNCQATVTQMIAAGSHLAELNKTLTEHQDCLIVNADEIRSCRCIMSHKRNKHGVRHHGMHVLSHQDVPDPCNLIRVVTSDHPEVDPQIDGMRLLVPHSCMIATCRHNRRAGQRLNVCCCTESWSRTC